ncbi:GNAT family N-acetyltransferase [Flavobacteriaceae bacterium GSB9]|nr:GNAT family N-acetyltransferase [Flavobacteriaceae bacterium GSB9]
MSVLKKDDFYNSLFLENRISECYNEIKLNNGISYYKKPDGPSSKALSNSYAITLFPDYFTSEILEKDYAEKKIVQRKLVGFAIKLDGIKNVENYLKDNLKSQSRSQIKKSLKRFNLCFNVEFQIYFGQISEPVYNKAITVLKSFLEVRFNEKNDTTEILATWDNFRKRTYNQINNKQASMFITYASGEIVTVGINYHANKILKAHVIGYDINYSKFSLGNIMVYNVLEWCLDHKYNLMDMGNGYLHYKKVWSNLKYHYHYHFIYKIKSVAGTLSAIKQMAIVKAKNFIKTLKLYERFKNSSYSKNSSAKLMTRLRYNIKDTRKEKPKMINIVDFNAKNYNFLKRPVIDFLYLTQEHISDTKVFKLNEKSFLIMGRKNIRKVIFE